MMGFLTNTTNVWDYKAIKIGITSGIYYHDKNRIYNQHQPTSTYWLLMLDFSSNTSYRSFRIILGIPHPFFQRALKSIDPIDPIDPGALGFIYLIFIYNIII